ncbi:MAG: prolyl oligopeptidase family serine peptidase [Gemmatimonadetes bacterium]|nr:prolyl oligopeptidase family serine peptidase [Gemmatimonadota bacterium]
MKKLRSVLAICAGVALVAACARRSYPPPPESRKGPVVDTIQGIAFTDDYRWLEDQSSPETRAWIVAQNAYAEAVVGRPPLRDRFASRLRELMDIPDVGNPRRAGDFEYFSMRRKGEEAARLYRRPLPAKSDTAKPSLDGTYEVVLDPATFDPSYRTLLGVLDYSSDGKLLMYSVRLGGGDEISVRVRNLETGLDLPDSLPRALHGGVGLDEDGRGFTYVYRSREIGPRLRHHLLGTSLSSDRELYGKGLPPTSFLEGDLVEDAHLRILNVQHGWASNDVFLQDTRTLAVRPLVVDSAAHFSTRWHGGRIWIRTDMGAPMYRLMSADPAHPDPADWREVIPEGEDVLESYQFIEGKIYATYLHEVSDRVRVFDMDGSPSGELTVPDHMSVTIRGDGAGKARLTLTGYLTPATTYEVDLASGIRALVDSARIPFDSAGFVVDQMPFTSKDGTRSLMYVIHKRGVPMDGTQPTILTGYGGFDVALKPSFSTTAAAWLEAGGVYAVATLRGGDEFGEAWHRDGMLENKQHVFDDFMAAADALVSSGYTRPERLAISGASNGGLLVGAALTQRPDLFRAVLCAFPDLDMVRFYTFTQTNNAPALLEYGDARIAKQFDAIRRYSPYQAVRSGTAYPAVMLETGDLDSRVPPLQARRMTARLQAATSSGRPVILFYDEKGGHAAGRGRPLSLRIEDTARELAFLAEQVGLAPVEPGG